MRSREVNLERGMQLVAALFERLSTLEERVAALEGDLAEFRETAHAVRAAVEEANR
jgi:hypothetical protein